MCPIFGQHCRDSKALRHRRNTDHSFPESTLRTKIEGVGTAGHPQMTWAKCGVNPIHSLPVRIYEILLARTRMLLDWCGVSYDEIAIFNGDLLASGGLQLVIQVSSPEKTHRSGLQASKTCGSSSIQPSKHMRLSSSTSSRSASAPQFGLIATKEVPIKFLFGRHDLQ